MALKSSSTARLPTLALQDGDVIIHSSNYPKAIFVVHKDVLSGKSRYFKAVLSKEWGREARSVKEGSNSPKVYEMDRQFDREINMALPVFRKTTKSLEDGERPSLNSEAEDRHPTIVEKGFPKQFL